MTRENNDFEQNEQLIREAKEQIEQQQSYRLAEELNISEVAPLYSYIYYESQMSDRGLDNFKSQLRNIDSIPPWDEFGLMGKLISYATRGKLQSYIFFFVWFLLTISTLILSILFAPLWLVVTTYQTWQRRNNNS